ncbi:hypothetical protein B0T09DRAFT_383398 [Sordaria sp. MPI-SDFR-AT-0083]|nr:hypothetical protein B0T09DRAFT_383398 [Sordaria sp. MPI-SDFR-AT-0083]
MSTPPDSLGLGHDEDFLRERAIEWMEELYQDLPNGIVVAPPPWYGIRPREMTDNVLVSMALFDREREMGRKGVT